MKNTLFASFVALVSAAAVANAQDLSGSVGVEVTENAAGNYVAETTLSFGISTATDAGLAFGGFTFETVDEGNLTVDAWQLGLAFDAATVSIGDQGDLFVGNDLEIVGGDTLANPANDDSVIVDAGVAAVFVGFSDITNDIGNVDNVQVSTTIGAVTAVVDHNTNTDENTLGVKGGVDLGDFALTGIATYAVDAEDFGYELAATYAGITGFVNGDDNDMAQNIGAAYSRDFDNLNFYVESSYNIDNKDTTVGAGVALNF
jgi:hypothetical protein